MQCSWSVIYNISRSDDQLTSVLHFWLRGPLSPKVSSCVLGDCYCSIGYLIKKKLQENLQTICVVELVIITEQECSALENKLPQFFLSSMY